MFRDAGLQVPNTKAPVACSALDHDVFDSSTSLAGYVLWALKSLKPYYLGFIGLRYPNP